MRVGFFFMNGEVKNSFCWSLSWTYSLNWIVIRLSLKLVVPKAGVIMTTFGGSESRGPPCGVPTLAQRARIPKQKKARIPKRAIVLQIFISVTLILIGE